MCPVCVSNMALLFAGLTTTGGLTALIAPNIFRRNKDFEINDQNEIHKPINEDRRDSNA